MISYSAGMSLLLLAFALASITSARRSPVPCTSRSSRFHLCPVVWDYKLTKPARESLLPQQRYSHGEPFRKQSWSRLLSKGCNSATIDTLTLQCSRHHHRQDPYGRITKPRWFDLVMQLNTLSVTRPASSIANTLLRGAFLRIASDLSGGTPFESIKTRVTVTREGPWEATCNIVRGSGIGGLWLGTPSRIIEGGSVGAVFMLGSTLTKRQIRTWGGSSTSAALLGGLVGGISQAIVMTPAGMIFTSLNANRNKPGYEHDNGITVIRRIVQSKGITGMYSGIGPMTLRQASNWASRAGFTEICRSVLGLSKYGLLGEFASGAIGGLASSWNTPIETVRVLTQRDVTAGIPPKSIIGYWKEITERDGIPGLFRGVTPRALQAIWQTTFLVVVPNLMGI